MPNYLFTIVIPTHNRVHLLQRAIASCLSQTFTHFELIIVDDGSSDETSTVAQSYADPRVHYLRIENARGVSHARNQGILSAQGQYVAFLDDDDEYLPDFLSTMHRVLFAPDMAIIFARASLEKIITTQEGTQKQEVKIWQLEQAIMNTPDIKFVTNFACQGVVVQKEALLNIGLFDEEMRVSEDVDLLLRLLAADCAYTVVPEVLVRVYISDAPSLSRTTKFDDFLSSNKRMVEKNAALLNQYPRLRRHYHLTLAGDYYRTHQPKPARAILFNLLKHSFFDTKVWEKLFRFEFLK